MSFPASSSGNRALYELLGLVFSSALYLFAENVLGYRFVPVLLLLSGWAVYLGSRIRRQPDFLKARGITTHNLNESVRLNAYVLIGGTFLLIAVRVWRGWTFLPGNALIIFGLYPFWAFVQQFALQGLLVRNLEKLDVPRAMIVIIGAAGYGLAHLPDVPLSLITGAVGVAWVSIFLSCPNIIPLSITHAVLGTLTYYWVLERDPVRELFETTVF